MDSWRRRANDFTNSLHSYRQTMDREDSQTISQTYSEDSLDTNSVRNKQYGNDKLSYAKNNEHRGNSTILAGNLANEQFVSSSSSYQTAEENSSHSDRRKSSLRDLCNISYDETSYLNIPDLNKCINLFHNEHVKRKFNTQEKCSSISSGLSENRNKENIDPCHVNKDETLEGQHNLIDTYSHAMLSSSLQHVAMPNERRITKSKSCTTLYESTRDTNHNVKANPFFLVPIEPPAEATTKINQKKIGTVASSFSALSLESSISSSKMDNHSTKENERYTSISSESTKDELNPAELRTLLQSLANKSSEKPRTTTTQEQMLRRLSVTFYDSPKNFTERLLTIIEESVIHNDSSMPMEFPEVSLCRLTAELRKRCKFIENETEPEWPSSLGISMSACMRDENREPDTDLSRKCINISLSPNKKLYLMASPSTPRHNSKSPKKAYQYTPKSTGQETPVIHNVNTPIHDSTISFLSTEAYCNSLYPNEYKTPSTNGSQLPSSQNMSSILQACDEQMASLQDSPNVLEQLRNAAKPSVTMLGSASQRDTVPEMKTPCHRLLTHKKCDKRESISRRSRRNKSYEMIEPDDLETTLMYEIAQKRQRCFDTARMMMKIDMYSDLAKTLQTSGLSVVTEANSSTSSDSMDAKLMETLMSCKKYQDYLEKHKLLLNLIQRAQSCRSNSPYKNNKKERATSCFVRAKQGNKVGVATLKTPSSSVTRKGNKSPSPARYLTSKKVATVSKPKLFITPGKNVTGKTTSKEKRIYFPDLVVDPVQQKKPNINSHAKSVYRQMGINYDSVISPVGMYIRGTDPNLMKNLRPKTDEMLLTPRKIQTPPSAIPKPEMRFKLSPKQTKEMSTATENKNVSNKFVHPKVFYKLPSHVRTIKETKNRKVGNRVDKLLSSMQDKVVIRHEGRTKMVQEDLDQPEIHYDSVEESVHIEQTARKTCFSRVQKNH